MLYLFDLERFQSRKVNPLCTTSFRVKFERGFQDGKADISLWHNEDIHSGSGLCRLTTAAPKFIRIRLSNQSQEM